GGEVYGQASLIGGQRLAPCIGWQDVRMAAIRRCIIAHQNVYPRALQISPCTVVVLIAVRFALVRQAAEFGAGDLDGYDTAAGWRTGAGGGARGAAITSDSRAGVGVVGGIVVIRISIRIIILTVIGRVRRIAAAAAEAQQPDRYGQLQILPFLE